MISYPVDAVSEASALTYPKDSLGGIKITTTWLSTKLKKMFFKYAFLMLFVSCYISFLFVFNFEIAISKEE